MNKKYLFSAILLCSPMLLLAQEHAIDTVFVFDNQLDNSRKVQKISKLKEEDLLKNTTNLSEVLRFQSPVNIKENGRGMVSSPSFRGTTAQQTAFIWNGINVNSPFLGQGDINNLNLLGYDQLEIKSGGGSVIYGSAAIGGTIHLNNELTFNKGFRQSLFMEYGSFETVNTFLKSSYSDEILSVKFSGNYSESTNYYEVPEKNYQNINGQYQNKNFNLGVAYKIGSGNTLAWQTQHFSGSQHYPTTEFGSRSKYLSDSFRTTLSWNFKSKKIQNILRLAYLEDEFQYFSTIEKPKSSGGTSEVALLKNDFNYAINEDFALNIITDYQLNKGKGYQSGITDVVRNAGAFAALLRWSPHQKYYFEAGLKKDIVENLETPILFSLSGRHVVNRWYSLIFNLSKNFRYPSFNDLYWQPGGNPDLKSEIAHQVELGNNFKYRNLSLNLSPYYLRIKNMIQWVPGSLGYWVPVNTSEVESFGLESQLELKKTFGQHSAKMSVGYVFTHAINKETGNFMTYVPKHKVFGNASYRYRSAELYAQAMFTGLTYTTTDEERSSAIPSYFVMNTGINIRVLKNQQLGIKINNLWDQVYETSAYYPMPKRNYSIQLLINF